MQHFNIAQLYLRFVIGIMLSLHNINKMQHIDQIAYNYPTHGIVSSVAWFYLTVLVQVACSVMLMMGLYVRVASTILALGTIFMLVILFQKISPCEVELYTLYTFVFIYLGITGGGNYAIDRLIS
ncbi:MAG: DoxX family membrane protein [Rikenellaceae bacterium]